MADIAYHHSGVDQVALVEDGGGVCHRSGVGYGLDLGLGLDLDLDLGLGFVAGVVDQLGVGLVEDGDGNDRRSGDVDPRGKYVQAVGCSVLHEGA